MQKCREIKKKTKKSESSSFGFFNRLKILVQYCCLHSSYSAKKRRERQSIKHINTERRENQNPYGSWIDLIQFQIDVRINLFFLYCLVGWALNKLRWWLSKKKSIEEKKFDQNQFILIKWLSGIHIINIFEKKYCWLLVSKSINRSMINVFHW